MPINTATMSFGACNRMFRFTQHDKQALIEPTSFHPSVCSTGANASFRLKSTICKYRMYPNNNGLSSKKLLLNLNHFSG